MNIPSVCVTFSEQLEGKLWSNEHAVVCRSHCAVSFFMTQSQRESWLSINLFKCTHASGVHEWSTASVCLFTELHSPVAPCGYWLPWLHLKAIHGLQIYRKLSHGEERWGGFLQTFLCVWFRIKNVPPQWYVMWVPTLNLSKWAGGSGDTQFKDFSHYLQPTTRRCSFPWLVTHWLCLTGGLMICL